MVSFVQNYILTAGESPEGLTITTVGPVINASPVMGTAASTGLLSFSINAAGQVVRGTTADTTTSTVKELYYHNHTVSYRNISNSWFFWNTTTSAWVASTSPKQLLNALNKNTGLTLTADELSASASKITTDQTVFGVKSVLPAQVTGLYWEATMTMADEGFPHIGIGTVNSLVVDLAWVGKDTTSIGWRPAGDVFYNNASSTVWPVFHTGDRLSMAINVTNWTFFGRVNNGNWNNNPSANPATNVGGFQIPTVMQTQGILPGISLWTATDSTTAYFERSDWRFIAPTGFASWSEVVAPVVAPIVEKYGIAAGAGYTTLLWSDDFNTTNTIATADGVGYTGNLHWWRGGNYPSFNGWTVQSTQHAQDIPLGQGAGNNSSTAGGILVLSGQVQNSGNSFITSIPKTITTVPAGGASQGIFNKVYIELYVAYDPATYATGSHPFATYWFPAFWSWTVEGYHSGFNELTGGALASTATEFDILEDTSNIDFGSGTPNAQGSSDHGGSFPGGFGAGSTTFAVGNYPVSDKQWHTYGFLWDQGNNFSFYRDGVRSVSGNVTAAQMNAINPNLPNQHLFIILGTGYQWPMYVDWVRVWGLPAPTGVPTPPAQAINAGYNRLVFTDDFTTTDTISPTQFAASGFKWYWNYPVPNPVPANSWTVNTAATAATIANGNSGGGPNASPSGGILSITTGQYGSIAGGPGADNGNIITIPGYALNQAGAVLPNTGHWTHFYVEAYCQMRMDGNLSTDPTNGWPAYWMWNAEGLGDMGFGSSSLHSTNPSEVDIMEMFGTIFGHPPGLWQSTLINHGVNGTITLAVPSGTTDNNWHTYGMLWTPGTMAFYFDNALAGSLPVTSIPDVESQSLFLILGTGKNWTFNIDWVRVWQA